MQPIYTSQSDDGQVLVAGTDGQARTDAAAGREAVIPDLPDGVTEYEIAIHSALLNAPSEEVHGLRAVLEKGLDGGPNIPVLAMQVAAVHPAAVKILARIADKDTRQRLAAVTSPQEMMKEVEAIAAEETQESHREYCERRDRETRTRYQRLERPH